MSKTKDALKKILVESIDLKKLANGVLEEIVEEALQVAVAKSPNKIDDVVMASLWPVLKLEISKGIEEKLDLGTILGLPSDAE